MIRSRPLALLALALAACSRATTAPAPPVTSPVTPPVTSPTGVATPPAATATSASPSATTDARTLRQFDLAHGPDDLTLPRTADIYARIDQPNVVTLTFDRAAQDSLAGWFAHRLPPGWTIDADANASLLFHDASWQGAFTCSSQSCALTLRRQG